ncbi:hypothetical protein KDK95_08015 [Actinospica sp. MGRD01-02]|uniref:Uncharacterized protein n=1 Tax=Actinospica acidithermotolerans TaxID=2828514 RepID=A0A941IHZ3_9ACTN|nr:hypothetical protein [Actinospica acidithermotolerans]MBR7826242.1 hypothetical protein [Actinospica acidithermotolerans]
MNNAGALASIAAGIVCATGGIAARPKVPDARNKNRTILAATAAAIPVLGWILWIGHPLATSLGFIGATIAAGLLRDQLHAASARRTAASDTDASNARAPQESDTAATSSQP